MNSRHASLIGILATAISALAQLFVFRVSIDNVGAELVGCWILLQAIFFISRISESGAGINLVRSLAASRSTHGIHSIRGHLIAGFILVLPPTIIIGVILAPISVQYLSWVTPYPSSSEFIHNLVALSFLVSILLALNAILGSILEGSARLVGRHILTLVTALTTAALIESLTKSFGLYGVPFAVLISTSISIIVATYLVLRDSKQESPLEVTKIIRHIWKESLSTSGIAIIRMGFEPLTKFVASAVGTLASVSAIELAFRISTQVRLLIQSAAQPLLYIGSSSAPGNESRLHSFEYATSRIVWANWISSCILISSAPLLIYIFYGHISWLAVWVLIVLIVGNAINSCGLTGYYLLSSKGEMDQLMRIHTKMALLNLAIGPIFGFLFGALGAVAAYSISFSYGGVVLLSVWAKHSKSTWYLLISSPTHWISISTAVAFASLGVSYFCPPYISSLHASSFLFVLVFTLVIATNYRAALKLLRGK